MEATINGSGLTCSLDIYINIRLFLLLAKQQQY